LGTTRREAQRNQRQTPKNAHIVDYQSASKASHTSFEQLKLAKKHMLNSPSPAKALVGNMDLRQGLTNFHLNFAAVEKEEKVSRRMDRKS
jgi:hypothetical protein